MSDSPTPPPSGSGWSPLETLSAGGWIILIIAVISSVVVFALPIPEREGLDFWTFSTNHSKTYAPTATQWNQAVADGAEGQPINLYTLDALALQRRVLNGFWADTPLADLMEIEGAWFYKFVTGPSEDVGFVDLAERLHSEGIYDTINPPSFSPWTSRGSIFGIPHDVHPVLMVYRADIVEDELGIDVSEIETWDDFVRVMRPVVKDLNGDGRPDRYVLNYWYNNGELLEVLMLQAGGGTFDTHDNIMVASEANAKVLATSVNWCFGEGRIAIDAPDFDAGGNQLRLEGRVVCAFMPDWLGGVWKNDLAPLGGKLKLMPLPAWELGGRRTSVWGGTMLGLPKVTIENGNFEDAWAFAKHLYLSKEVAEALFKGSNIISPVMSYWDEPFYAEPDPFFSGQTVGKLYIDQAPDVPLRPSHPFRVIARNYIGRAATDLRNYAQANNNYTVDFLLPEARRLLEIEEQRVLREMQRNVFLRPASDEAEGDAADVVDPEPVTGGQP